MMFKYFVAEGDGTNRQIDIHNVDAFFRIIENNFGIKREAAELTLHAGTPLKLGSVTAIAIAVNPFSPAKVAVP